MDYAGASLRRDEIDQRVVGEVRAGSAPYKGSKMQYWDDKGNLVTLKDSDKKPGIIDTPSDAAGGYKEVKRKVTFGQIRIMTAYLIFGNRHTA